MKLREVESIPISSRCSRIIKEFAASEMKYAEVMLDEGMDYKAIICTMHAYISRHKNLGVKASSRKGKIYLRKEVQS